MQRRSEYPGLNIPQLDPYIPAKPWTISFNDPNYPVSFTKTYSSMSIYGVDNATVREFL